VVQSLKVGQGLRVCCKRVSGIVKIGQLQQGIQQRACRAGQRRTSYDTGSLLVTVVFMGIVLILFWESGKIW